MTEQELHDAIAACDYQLAQEIGHRLDGQRARPTLLGSALWYAGQGLPVFPCAPRQKRPTTRNGLKDATTDPEQIKTWWRQTPAANIAAPTGVLFDVIDVDGPQGVATIAPHLHRIRPLTTGTVSTPRPGGLHYYLPPDPKRRNGAGQGPGVDWRGTGGYVLLPPSITDEHGEGLTYRWLRPPTLNAAQAAA